MELIVALQIASLITARRKLTVGTTTALQIGFALKVLRWCGFGLAA